MSLRLTFFIALGLVISSPSFGFSQCQRGQQGGAGGQARVGSSFTASRLPQLVGTSTLQTTVPVNSLLLQRQLQLQLLLQQQQITQQTLLLQQQQLYQNMLLQSDASLRQQLLNTNAYVRLLASQELARRALMSQSAQ